MTIKQLTTEYLGLQVCSLVHRGYMSELYHAVGNLVIDLIVLDVDML